MDRIHEAISVVPSPRQLAWQQMEFYAFAHFGMNTFTGREWGDGTASPELFNPTDSDPAQWVRAVKSAGMAGLLLTCKHHDGFCLWPSAYTDYSVKASPWKDGKGDMVAMVADACHRGGIKFGVYLSPWDRHEASYGTGEAYNTFYKNQLRELAENYGEIFCFWFDGACGEGKNGKKQEYDWEGYYRIIRDTQPNAVINVCGPDVRWCGNEAGACRASEWSVVPAGLRSAERTAAHSQQADDGEFSRRVSSTDEDLGSRAAIADAGELVWYPAEVDTSIRKGWFYHPEEDSQLRTLEELETIYDQSVGGNACLLLNIPPDTRGLFADPDVELLARLGQRLRSRFAQDLTAGAALSANCQQPSHPAVEALHPDETRYWQAPEGREQAVLQLKFDRPVSFSQVVLGEYLPASQRIEAFELRANRQKLAQGTVVGHKRICRFAPVNAEALEIRITQSRVCATLRRISVYA